MGKPEKRFIPGVTEEKMRRAPFSAVLAVCVALAPATHAVAMLDEGVANMGDNGENVVQQLDALFSHHTEKPDLGESVDVAAQEDTGKHVTYHFHPKSQQPNLGESKSGQEKSDRAHQMVQFGDLLGVLQRQRPSDRGNTVASLNQALKESLQAAQEKLMYDKKVADTETKYNRALSAELMLRKNKADDKVKEAEKEKLDADKASSKATPE